jgi:hypothetical protein
LSDKRDWEYLFRNVRYSHNELGTFEGSAFKKRGGVAESPH